MQKRQKKEGRWEGGKVVGVTKEAEESKQDSTYQMKNFKEAQKTALTFARKSKMLTTLYIYNIIYNII